ncbi:DUF4231 domain-containing protein [uncultured Roseobacter sp.]|uniref:DUF4231 domain-containing protein n=1 Tax=uncultured Roseobacter sp. TaxID=114847 RepID=UPI00262244B7|nr:DUF4231 domain-containing protein [uncultured Roseobacter sp.]
MPPEDQTTAHSTPADDSNYPRLENQIVWYDAKSVTSQRRYFALKSLQIIIAAAIPVVSLIDPTKAVVPGALGALVLVLEGFQELGSYRQNWQKYRSSCEALRHEKYLYMAGSGPYTDADVEKRTRLLAERVEAMISEEHTNWVAQFKNSEGAAPQT